ncbi:hypothetical protein ACFQ1M_04530 [Sungkyunkwania multivorans]|uniref:Uncharacterized protein n=1 Tax=Sungkyunkwania multivorans TaxID=1173618 RepID=A0ABW3CUJ9_9FLAO
MKKVLFLILWLITWIASAQELRLKKGIIVDSVSVKVSDSVAYSYALYLPKKFEKNEATGVVFIFDPRAKGKEGLQPFVAAAEVYNLILIGSNNSRNGAYQENLKIFSDISDHVFSHFKIDRDQLYLSGFSGGSRLATAIGVVSNEIDGVIGCGAGFPISEPLNPKENKYPYIGVVGNADFNYLEMRDGKKYLDNLKIDNELLVFDGGHVWPPSTILIQAVGWLRVLSHNRGVLQLSKESMERQYQQHLAFAEELLENKEWSMAYNAYNRLIKNYQGHFEVRELKDTLKQIRKEKAYKEYKREENRYLLEERDMRATYLEFFNEDVTEAVLDNLGYWEAEMKKLKIFQNHASASKRLMGKRLSNLLLILAIETRNAYNLQEHVEKLLFLNEFLVMLKPDYHEPYIDLMKVYVKKGEYQNALGALEQLFMNGYKDKDRLYRTEGIALLRVFPEFKEILDKY